MNTALKPNNVVQLARQGNPKAIAAVMNGRLQPVGITVKAALKDDCLQIILEADKPLDQQKSSAFIRKVITSLKLESQKSIKALAIYAQKTGESLLSWRQEFELLAEKTLDVPAHKAKSTDHEELTLDSWFAYF